MTAPPYDVIDDDALAAFRARDPHNVAHLTLEPDADVAGERLREWLADGVLVRDETPAVWWLEQDFVGPDGVARSRRGIVASLRAEPYSNGAVLPHERTHRGPIEGRLALLRATRTQLEPIFLLYDGAAPIEGPPPRPPDLEVGGSRLWRLEGDHGVAAALRRQAAPDRRRSPPVRDRRRVRRGGRGRPDAGRRSSRRPTPAS